MKRLSLITFTLLTLLALPNCKSLQHKSKPYIPVQSITIEKLEAKELSENYKTLSSKKDEILVFAYYLKHDTLMMDSWQREHLSFTETEKVQEFSTRIAFTDLEDCKLVFILVELDSKSSASEMDRIFQSNFRLLTGIPSNKTRLQLLLGDDDLLDLKIISLKKVSPQDNYQIQFSGVHLFDEYEYFLHCKFE